MSQQQPPRPRKLPKQSRSLLLVKAIEEACLKILQNEGAKQLTTQRIADVAGVNIASVYQYFPNKEAILAGVYDSVLQQFAATAAKRFKEFYRLSTQSLDKTLAEVINIEAEHLTTLYRLSPDFYSKYCESYDTHQTVNQLTQAMENPSWEEWFPHFLSKHQTQLRPTDINTLSFIARNTLLLNLKAAVKEQPDLLEDTHFKAELLYQLLAYLLPRPKSINECRLYF